MKLDFGRNVQRGMYRVARMGYPWASSLPSLVLSFTLSSLSFYRHYDNHPRDDISRHQPPIMRLSITGALAALVTLAVAADITLYLPPKPNPFTLPATTHATPPSLHPPPPAPPPAVNTFDNRNVTEGESYLADIYCPGHAYHPLRVDIGPAGEVSVWETYRGNDWGNKGEALEVREGSYGKGVELRSLGAKNYFIERPRCEWLLDPCGSCNGRVLTW